jgi:hypothetical protein
MPDNMSTQHLMTAQERALADAALDYHEFTELPEFTVPQWRGDKMLNVSDPYKWSGKTTPPEIGTNVRIYLSDLGTGDVLGYFAEYGWLGVLVKLHDPPHWWNRANGNAHLFGVDLAPQT